MSRLDMFISKINFKKSVRVYIILSVLLIVVSISSLVFISREKIYMALDYNYISDTFRKQGIDDNLKLQLQQFASSSSDIKNILILDKDDNVIFKINNSLVGSNVNLQFTPYPSRRNYLQDNLNKGILYKITKEENIILDRDYIDSDRRIRDSIDGELFYEKDFVHQDVYLLNYIIQRSTGSKLFVIRDVSPIPYAEGLLKLTGAIIGLIYIVYWIGLALWVYKDANKRISNPALWGFIVLLTNLAGLIVYIMYKQSSRICFDCGALQSRENIYCVKCGIKINETCSCCNMVFKKDDIYCSKCGSKL